MPNQRLTFIRVIRWAVTLMTIFLALLLCFSCISLYKDGICPDNTTAEGVRNHDIYTRENVTLALRELSPWMICWLMLMVLSATMPATSRVSHIDPEISLRLLLPHVTATPPMLHQRRLRYFIYCGTAVVMTICLTCITVYMLDISHFTSWDLEMVMGDMVRSIGIYVFVAIAAACICAALISRSYRQEWEAAKKADKISSPKQDRAISPTLSLGWIRIILATLALALIIAGILNGGMYDVLVKAINICTECIGLG